MFDHWCQEKTGIQRYNRSALLMATASVPSTTLVLPSEPATGFHVQTIGTLFAEIPPGKRSGAHRHSYEETEYVISGNGYTIVEDQRVDWKEGDTLLGWNNPTRSEVINIGWTGEYWSTLPFRVAVDKGFFEKEGLQPRLITISRLETCAGHSIVDAKFRQFS